MYRSRSTFLAVTLGLSLTVSLLLAADLKKVEKLARECASGKEKSCRELVQIARMDENNEIREAAIRKLTDQAVLAEIAGADVGTIPDLGMAAMARLSDQNLLAAVAQTAKRSDVREAAVEKLSDQAILAHIVQTDQNRRVRRAAVARLIDEPRLAQVAQTDKDIEVRTVAVAKLTDPALLARFAQTGEDIHLRRTAVRKITDQFLLAKLVETEDDLTIRAAAIANLENQHPLVRQLAGDLNAATDSWVPSLCRLKLATLEPPIRLRFPDIRVRCDVSDLSQGYGIGGFRADHSVGGENVSIAFYQDGASLSSASWETDFPGSIHPGTYRLAAKVSGTEFLDQFIRNSQFTQMDLQVLSGSEIIEVRKAAVLNLTNKALVAEAAHQALLAETAQSDAAFNLRRTAVSMLTDQAALAQIAKTRTATCVFMR